MPCDSKPNAVTIESGTIGERTDNLVWKRELGAANVGGETKAKGRGTIRRDCWSASNVGVGEGGIREVGPRYQSTRERAIHNCAEFSNVVMYFSLVQCPIPKRCEMAVEVGEYSIVAIYFSIVKCPIPQRCEMAVEACDVKWL